MTDDLRERYGFDVQEVIARPTDGQAICRRSFVLVDCLGHGQAGHILWRDCNFIQRRGHAIHAELIALWQYLEDFRTTADIDVRGAARRDCTLSADVRLIVVFLCIGAKDDAANFGKVRVTVRVDVELGAAGCGGRALR
ncbi:hypothetical protein PQQ53_05610 [Paraburkholderia strydomiana]|uniref:hypothetical protein n=1 Tax=Paraburkholderia strydomiana TaxID=1245417 RepID=UPI0038BA7C3F